MRREVLVEAGHRCAIPTCRSHPVEVHHIEDWTKVQQHEPHNLIALCPNCHARATRGEIDILAMQAYKANVRLLRDRYSDLERRVLDKLVKQNAAAGDRFALSGLLELLMENLVGDGILQRIQLGPQLMMSSGLPGHQVPTFIGYQVTGSGRVMIERLRAAQSIDEG